MNRNKTPDEPVLNQSDWGSGSRGGRKALSPRSVRQTNQLHVGVMEHMIGLIQQLIHVYSKHLHCART